MTGEALFFFPLFRGVLRHLDDRRVLERARCSEHEAVGDVSAHGRREPRMGLRALQSSEGRV